MTKEAPRRNRNDGRQQSGAKKETEGEERQKEAGGRKACFWRETDPALRSTSISDLLIKPGTSHLNFAELQIFIYKIEIINRPYRILSGLAHGRI